MFLQENEEELNDAIFPKEEEEKEEEEEEEEEEEDNPYLAMHKRHRYL